MLLDHLNASIQVEPGLSDFYIGLVSDFTTIQKPTAPFTAPGDEVTIKTAHVPVTDRGFLRVYQDKKRHSGKGDPIGTSNARTFNNEFDVFIPGVDKVTMEWVKKAMRSQIITLHRDADCDNPQIIQLGDGCKNAEIEINYTTGTFEPTGEKGFFGKVKWVGIPKFYEATIPIAVPITS